ncbi:hypothetical protein [Microbacterium sp.]|uniref:hypothetical protein n=1 Tax=Microbacterium sp. TaxID=51671 RepID=UPI0028120890|nr:hypothetical protein [Microbacterium sp.]
MAETLSKEEREAVKERAKELRAQAKAGRNREAGEKAVREEIGKLDGDDREIADGFYAVVSEGAPHLVPKTYYGMPGFANDEGKIVVFLQPASKFGSRYSTIGFEDRSTLDEGDMWATHFGVARWSEAVAEQLRELVRRATS